jgi:hypothetical protein
MRRRATCPASRKLRQVWPSQQLPDIGHERWHDDKRSGLDRRHEEAEAAHRHSRQTHAGHALDDAGEKENRADHCSLYEVMVRHLAPVQNPPRRTRTRPHL